MNKGILKKIVSYTMTGIVIGSFASYAIADDVNTKETVVVAPSTEMKSVTEESWVTKYNFKPILVGFVQYDLNLTDSANQRRTQSQW
ncbi:hypothetical protein CO045_03570, partial [Candidatus Peregrinibacteria bacterium CG_4_9_14_0_2_um_filter_41_14]